MCRGRPGRKLVGMPSTTLPTPMRARTQLWLFLATYLLYDAGRWLPFAGHAPAASGACRLDHPVWVSVSAHVAVEGSASNVALQGPRRQATC